MSQSLGVSRRRTELQARPDTPRTQHGWDVGTAFRLHCTALPNPADCDGLYSGSLPSVFMTQRWKP